MCMESAHDDDDNSGGGGRRGEKTSAFKQSSSWQGMYGS